MEKIRIITDSAADLDNIRPEVTVIPPINKMKEGVILLNFARPLWTA